MGSDSDLQQKVMQELEWEPSVDATHIVVAVKNGIVTLSGYVEQYADKPHAERAVERMEGVRALINEIELQLPGSVHRNDLDIVESALTALKLNVLIPRDRVKIVAQGGWITLEGDVDWQYQRMAAEDTVRSILGIKGISNQIGIKAEGLKADIKDKIRSALVRNAHVDANQVNIVVSGNKVILSGNVRSWSEKHQAEAATWSAPGIAQVENNIVIGT
jgi:osmotically-inducible protein OsmY